MSAYARPNRQLLSHRRPRLHAYAVAVHTKRGEGELAHPIVKTTKAPTGRIPFKWLRTGSKLIAAATAEIKAAGY